MSDRPTICQSALAEAQGDSHCLTPQPFPAELWTQIIEEYSTHNEWVALCQTCRFFLQIALACLYKKVELCKYNDPASEYALQNRFGMEHSRFERSLRKRPELGGFVRHLSIYVEPPILEHHSTPSPSPFLSELIQFPNLESLRIQDVNINVNICDALHSHPRLRSVEFMDCTVDDSISEPYIQDALGSQISEARIFFAVETSTSQEGLWAAITPTGLTSLTLASANLESPRPQLVLSNVMMYERNHMLETLAIDFFSSSIIQFLISSPRLRHLMIDCVLPDPTADCLAFSTLSSDAIPLLEHYGGPAELSKTLLKNRPVHHVGLDLSIATDSPEDFYVDVLHSLQASSVPILELELQVPDIGSWLWHVPDTIYFLKFHGLHLDRETFARWLPGLSRLTNLHTICGTISRSRGQVWSQEDVARLSEACPSLREFCPWHERWIMMKPNVWICMTS